MALGGSIAIVSGKGVVISSGSLFMSRNNAGTLEVYRTFTLASGSTTICIRVAVVTGKSLSPSESGRNIASDSTV